MKRVLLIILTAGLIVLFAFFYTSLEMAYYSDFSCGCSSACAGFYVTKADKIVGYGLIVLSIILITASLWKFRKLSRWWSLPGLFVLTLSVYGNSFMLFNPNVCGVSLNESYLYFFHEKVGDWAKSDFEHIDMDSLKQGNLRGQLIGYFLKGDKIYIYRIGEEPIELKTSFLFWNIDKSDIIDGVSYGLDSYAMYDNKNYIELVGGKGMPLEAFRQEPNNKFFTEGMTSQKLINLKDGTTRLYIYK